VENEYGSLQQCDHQYLSHLQDLFLTYLGKDVVLFTNNGCVNRMLECGTLPGMLSTLDFGGGYVKHSLASILLRGRSDKGTIQKGTRTLFRFRAFYFNRSRLW